MDDRTTLAAALRQHLLLERGFGVEAYPRGGTMPAPR
ncbi:MAG: hypothetical protein RLZZ127_1470, partial [Planctomycetota bacterium]